MKPKIYGYLALMESQKDIERRKRGCQRERMPDSPVSILATSYLEGQHDAGDFDSDKHGFSSQICCVLTV